MYIGKISEYVVPKTMSNFLIMITVANLGLLLSVHVKF